MPLATTSSPTHLNDNGNIVSTTQNIEVIAGDAAKIQITEQPTTKQTGATFSSGPKVRLLDAFNNPVTISDNITVTATLVASNSAALSPVTQSSAVTFTNGIADLSGFDIVALPGSYRLVFEASNFAPVTSSVFVITVADPSILTWQTPPPSDLVTGINMPQSILEIHDAYGNLVTGDNSTEVIITSTAGSTLSRTVATAQNGVVTFNGFNMIAATGSHTLKFTASNSNVASINDVSISHAITISNDVAASLEVELVGLQTPKAGLPLTFDAGGYLKVNILDRFGNLVTTGDDRDLTIGVSSVAVGVAGSTTSSAVVGVADFSANGLKLEGTETSTGYNLIFSSTTTRGTTIIGRQSFTLSPGVASKLQLTTQPPVTISRTVPFAPGAVKIFDAFDNEVETSSNLVVQLWNGTTSKSEAVVAASNDAHTFEALTYNVAPSTGYQLRYFVQGYEDNAIFSRTFEITSGDAASLSFLVQPAGSATINAGIAPFSVEVLDADGYRVNTGESVTVTLNLKDSGNSNCH